MIYGRHATANEKKGRYRPKTKNVKELKQDPVGNYPKGHSIVSKSAKLIGNLLTVDLQKSDLQETIEISSIFMKKALDIGAKRVILLLNSSINKKEYTAWLSRQPEVLDIIPAGDAGLMVKFK